MCWISLFIGMSLGACFGALITALLVANREDAQPLDQTQNEE